MDPHGPALLFGNIEDHENTRGNRGIRLLIDATKPNDRPRAEKYFGERFAVVSCPDKEATNKVRNNWDKYGIQKKR